MEKRRSSTGRVQARRSVAVEERAIPAQQGRSASEIIILVVATLMICALGYSVAPVLSPFVLVAAIAYILYPLRANPLPGRLIRLSIFLFLLWFLHSILGILAPFVVAFLIAYILNPIVIACEGKRIPRWASSLGIVLLMVGLGVLAVLFLLPVVLGEFQGIIAGTNEIAADLAALLESGVIFDLLAGYGVEVEQARSIISEQLVPRLEGVLTTLFGGLFDVLTGISSLAMHVVNIILVPFLTFYILMDYPVIALRVRRFFTGTSRTRFEKTLEAVNDVFGSYLRGSIVVGLIQGTISGFGLWLIGVEYSIVLGVMVGVLNFIPYVGLLTSMVVSSIVATFSGGPVFAKVIAIVVLFLSQKLLEATLLGPKIIGPKVGLHPVFLILCLLVFGHFLGLLGMLIAVPATALMNVALQKWEAARTPSHPS